MNKAIRHGDLLLRLIDNLPEGLKQSKTKVIMKGSHGHDHSFNGGKIYFKNVDNFVFGYLVAKNTTLFHPEHGKVIEGELREAKIPDGIYELRKQNEDTNEGMKQVID